MRSLKTREAAALLSVSTNTLRTWERKFGYPKPLRTPGRHRAYTYAEIVALRDALRRGLSVPSAISAVREGLGADMEALVIALDCFDLPAADRAMEASLALRSMERSVSEVLLPALDDIRRSGVSSTRWAIAHRWGVDWLGRAQRVSRPADPGASILIGDASGGPMGAAGPRMHALELFCQRGGIEVMILPVAMLGSIEDAIAAVEPSCVVVAGGHSSDEQVSRWTYAVRSVAGVIPIALYMRPTKPTKSERSALVLATPPLDAHRELVDLVAAGGRAKDAASDAEANRFAKPG